MHDYNCVANISYAFRPTLTIIVSVMENSDFNTVTSDSTTVIDELNHKRTRLQYRGIILVLAPMICFLLEPIFVESAFYSVSLLKTPS
jgi:hypothetical protein